MLGPNMINLSWESERLIGWNGNTYDFLRPEKPTANSHQQLESWDTHNQSITKQIDRSFGWSPNYTLIEFFLDFFELIFPWFDVLSTHVCTINSHKRVDFI